MNKKYFAIITLFLITQLHGMEPGKKVKVITNDEKEYKITEKIAKYSTTLEHALEVEIEEAIPLQEVSSQQWEVIAPLLLVIENKSQLQKDIANLSLDNLLSAIPAVEFLNIPLLENQMIIDLAERITEDPNIAFRNEFDELPARIQPDIADKLLKISGIMYSSPFISRTLTVGSIVYSVTFSLDGNLLASGSEDGIIRIWDVKTLKEIKKLEGHTELIKSVAFSPDGKYIASGSGDKTILIWDVETGQKIKKLTGHKERINSISFSPDGNYLASGSSDNTVRVWDVKTGQEIKKLIGHRAWIPSVAFSPDDNYVASGSGDNTIRIWDIETGQQKWLIGHKSWIRSVAYSPDGNYLASGSSDATIRIWDVKKFQEIRGGEIKILEGHIYVIFSVAFSPDGNYLAFGSGDKTIRIWNVKTLKEIKKLEGHTLWVNSVAYSPDGNYLASGSHDNTIRIWQPDLLLIFKILGAKQLAVILKVFRGQELNENEVTIYNRLPADITNIYRR